MNSDSEKIIYQLRILRTLIVSSIGQAQSIENGLRKFWSAEALARLSGMTHKMKVRGDSVRVLLQTIDDGAVAGPAAVALVESVLSYTVLIKSTVTDLIEQARVEEYSSFCLPQIEQFNAELARTMSPSTALNSNANRLFHVLRLTVPIDVAVYYCVSAACNFAEGIKIAGDGLARIVRELKFPPEYQQAGLSILNYFSAVLEDKYPGIPVEVSIQQYHDKVTLLITLPDGSQEVVEKVLTEYGLVLSGKILPEDFIENKVRALALQQKLELANMEVRQTRDLLRLQEQYSTSRIATLEQDVKNLYTLLERELSSKDELQRGFVQLSLQSPDNHLNEQLVLLLERLGTAIENRDRQHAQIVLEDIREASPDLFTRVSLYFYESATTGVIGSVAFEWIKSVINMLPR